MAVSQGDTFLIETVALLAAAVITVPLFKRLGLGIVLGYLAAGFAVGPWGAGLFGSPAEILHIAELGVVLLLFVIGLELNLTQLSGMRRDIFGLGVAQLFACALPLGTLALVTGFSVTAAIVAGFGLALSSTAFALQLLQERGQLRSRYGQKAFAILLFQDMSIVPLLALVPLMAPFGAGERDLLQQALLAIGALALVAVIGRYLLNPLFGLLARVEAQEIMLVAALLVVIGAALVMHLAGLSMALGAFLAGVLLAESSFRHQLEADIEPFRTLLLGLFFMGVGMSVDLALVAQNWQLVLAGLFALMAIKGGVIWAVARGAGESNADALRIALTLPQGGEFGFVLFGTAVATGVMLGRDANILSAIVILSMAATPLLCGLFDRAAARMTASGYSHEIVESFTDASPRVIIIGFGRFGQTVAQMLMAEDIEVVAIDRDPDRIKVAQQMGYHVYYGDAARADVLRMAGASTATLIALCIDNHAVLDRALATIREFFPQAVIYCRARDRLHFIELQRKGADFAIRETFESAVVFGRQALAHVGIAGDRIAAVEEDVRRRDEARLRRQKEEGMLAGAEMLHQRTPRDRAGAKDDRSE